MTLRKLAIVLTLLLAVSINFSGQVQANTTDLIISEYIEGSSFNKAIEIYNGTGNTVDLSTEGYTLELYSNGSSTASQTTSLTGSINDGDVFVLAHGSADADILAEADVTNSSVINFNGDDAVVLRKSGAVIDAFGQVGVDPGSAWSGGGISTVNATLRRQADICAGDTDEMDAFDPSVEWDGFDSDTFDGLGSHTANCTGGSDTAPAVASTTPADGATNVAVDAALSVTFDEAVTLSGTFDLTCTPSGNNQTGLTSTTGDNLTFDFAHADFTQGDSCSLTIPAASVTDNDTDDPPDTMADDFTLNFDVVAPAPTSSLIITEIMYDPNSDEDDWEWIEIYNAGSSPVDLSGYVIDDNNSVAHSSANIATGSLAAGQSAVLYNADDISAADFQAAWGTVNLIAVTNWNAMGLNNGGDMVSLWSDFASYSGDHENHANAIDTVDYDQSGFADPTGASIYLTDLNADNNVGSNWAESTDGASTPLFAAYASLSAGGNVGGEIGSPGTPPAAPTPQLLLTEIVVTPTDGEFIEIHNPNGSPVDLSDVYLTDATFAGGGTYYYNIVTGSNAGGGGFSDFHARFPDGASIAAGEYQTVALAGSAAFIAEYGLAPTYELFDDGSNDGEQVMREALSGSISGQGGLTNGGEVVILYHWDGAGDLVTDLDYAVWGDKAEAVDKTGVALDGPDADSDATAYQPDTAIADQDILGNGAHAGSKSWQREDLTEGAEIKTGGNGAGGHNEMSEDLTNTWCEGDPSPAAAATCDVVNPPVGLKIHQIQGTGLTVTNPGSTAVITGVVVGDYQGGDELNGFFLQEEDTDADGDANTSEGIFVYCGGCAVAVAEGNIVEVTGIQEDFFGMSQLDVPDAGTAGNVTVIDAGDNLSLVTPTAIDLPAPASTTAEATFEAVEGMLVQFVDDLTATEYFEMARYGQIVLSEGGKLEQFTHTNLPDATGFAAHQDDIARRRIILDDLNNTQNSTDPVYHPQPGGFSTTNFIRGGYTVSNLTGVLHWSFAGFSGTDAWRIRPQITNPVQFTAANPRQATPADVGGDIKVATLNVLNYFTTIDVTSSNSVGDCGPSGTEDCRGADSAAELQRQTDKLVAALAAIDADVVGLVEIENNATASLQAVVDALNAVVGAGTYNYVNSGLVGGDVIKVGFIYKPGTVALSGAHTILDSNDFIDPNNTGTPRNRAALAQTFEVVDNSNPSFGEKFTAVVNHLKSKGSGCGAGDDDTTTGQGNCNVTRTLAAQKLVDWLATDPTGSGDPDFLILGDLNAYAMEDPIQAIQAGADDTPNTTDDYTNLILQFSGAAAYSFVFDGQWGYLDHALATASLADQVTGVTEWHINSDEVNLLDYNDAIQDAGEASFEAKPGVNPLYAPDQFRVSDHDPLLIGLSLTSPPQCNGVNATIYLNAEGEIVGGPQHGHQHYKGFTSSFWWHGYQGIVTLLGTDGDDVIVGTDGRDRIRGGNGNDLICGLAGNDFLSGNDGNDTIFSGEGKDWTSGNKGDDTLYGEGGRDRLFGGRGDDTLNGGDDRDLLVGGHHTDTCDGGDDDDHDFAISCETKINIP